MPAVHGLYYGAPMLDDDARAILGLPNLPELAKAFLDELPNHESGLSPRQMNKLKPHVDILTWMHVGHWLHQRGNVSHSWRPLKGDLVSAQESAYTLRRP